MEIEFDSSLANVDYAAAVLRDWCEARGLSSDVTAQIELALVEALTNVVVHAYARCEGKPIALQWCRDDDYLQIEIRDEGRPIDALPEGELPEPEAESGRGWYIIRALVDSVAYRREDGWNILVLRKAMPSE